MRFIIKMAAALMGKVSDKVSFAAKIPILMKATSDDEFPTQGIMYQEINSITYESVSSCTNLLDFLMERLKKKSPVVKYKVLKVMQYLVTNGHSEFRSALRHRASPIRETQSFLGTFDPLHGDSLNQRAREKASELIEILFDVDSDKPRSTVMRGPSKKMEGFGNTPIQTKNESWTDTMKTLTGQYVSEISKLMRSNEDHHQGDRLVDHHFHSEHGGSRNYTGEREVAAGIFNNHPFLGVRSSAEVSSDPMPRWSSKDYTSEPSGRLEGEESLAPEVQLVNEITAEGGVRATPSRDRLTKFSNRCAKLNVETALHLLNEKLKEPVTEVQLKVLCVIDHLLKCDLPQIAHKVSRCCPDLEELNSSAQERGSVKAKAAKILTIINAQVTSTSQLSGLSRADEEKNSDLPTSLLDLAETPPPRHENSSLFAGMDVHSTPTPAAIMESTGEADASAGMSRLFDGFSISTGSQDSGNQWGGFDGVTPVSQHQNLPIAESRQGQTDFDTAKHDPPVDIFDPLCGKAAGSDELKAKLTPNGFGNLLDLTNTPPAAEPVNQDLLLLSSKSSQNASHQPHPMGYSGLTGFHMNYSTGSSGLTGSTPSTWAQSSISSTVQGSRVPYVGPQALPLSSTSTVPLRLPKPSSQKGDFSFVGKSGKADAFSFVQDQMKARKK